MSVPQRKPGAPSADAVPKAVVNRLSLYLRELQRMVREDKATTSSSELGRVLGFSDAQVRKDLAYFGHFGHPGIGYHCQELAHAIRRILGTDQQWLVALIGVGNLGRALLGYKGFTQQGFRIVAAFDIDLPKAGKTIEGVTVYHLDALRDVIRNEHIRLGMIAVPATAAQSVANQLVEAGVEGIVNFAPITLALPDGISTIGVDLAIELEQISFAVVNQSPSR
jgi:redox-sensing transcriptional repressor